MALYVISLVFIFSSHLSAKVLTLENYFSESMIFAGATIGSIPSVETDYSAGAYTLSYEGKTTYGLDLRFISPISSLFLFETGALLTRFSTQSKNSDGTTTQKFTYNYDSLDVPLKIHLKIFNSDFSIYVGYRVKIQLSNPDLEEGVLNTASSVERTEFASAFSKANSRLLDTRFIHYGFGFFPSENIYLNLGTITKNTGGLSLAYRL